MGAIDPGFARIIPQIVKGVIAVAAHVDSSWVDASISRCFSSDGTSIGKLRIQLPNGNWDKSQRISIKVLDLIDRTWEKMHKKSKYDIFYGFKLTVRPDGKHEIEYNYDPNCIDNPKFVDW
jgi:hypothetical protein